MIKGKLKQQWAKLTDDDLQFVQGKQRELIGGIEGGIGHIMAAVEKAINGSGIPWCCCWRSAPLR